MNIKLAGAVQHFKLFFLEIQNLNKYPFNFNVYDGPNLCKWNGGRINRDITLTPVMVNFYNKNNIGVFLTFSNDIIDLTDPTGNHLLELLNHNPLNGIICSNEDLRNYVKEKYPEYKLIFSITGNPSDISITDSLITHYKDLEPLYDIIVPRYEMVFNESFYTQVDTSKYELIVNDTCIYGCNKWMEHFKEDAKMNRQYNNPWLEAPNLCHKVEECWIKSFNPDIGSEVDKKRYGDLLGMDFTKDMYKKAIGLGYKNFKITGRENETCSFKDSLFDNLGLLMSAYD